MKQKKLDIKVITLIVVVVMSVLLTLVSCQYSSEVTDDSVQELIIFEVVGPEGVIATGNVKVAIDDSAYDATVKFFNGNGIEFSESTFGDFAYISEIEGYKEGEYGAMSGWLFYINGESPLVGCGSCEVEDNDTIKWEYSKGE